jgi:hypothetical protein
MPFTLETFVNDILNSTGANSVFNNPIYTAILITLIIMLIIFFMYRDSVDEDEPFWPMLIKTGIYTGLVVLGALFLHFKNLDYEYDQKYQNQAISKIVETSKGVVPAVPEAAVTPVTEKKKEGAAEPVVSGAFTTTPTFPEPAKA